MKQKHPSSFSAAPVRSLGVALLLAALAACGGGGGGGGGNDGAVAGGGGGTDGGGGGVGVQPNCDAVRAPTAGGFMLGVCSTRQGGSELNAHTFKSLAIVPGQPLVAPNYAGVKPSYTLNLAAPVLASGPATLGPEAEDRCRIFIGTRPGYTLQVPSAEALRTNPEAPRVAVISFTQGSAACPEATLADGTRRPGRAATDPSFNTAAKLVDFGTFERYVGGQELYYGGWYVPRQQGAFNPAVALRFPSRAAIGGGMMGGYLFTAISSFGLSGVLGDIVYTPPATAGGAGRLVGTIANFGYSRANETVTSPQVRFEGPVTIEATVQPSGAFSGTLRGSGFLGATAAAFNGAIEGVVVTVPAAGGAVAAGELAARVQGELAVPGASAPGARMVGALATNL